MQTTQGPQTKPKEEPKEEPKINSRREEDERDRRRSHLEWLLLLLLLLMSCICVFLGAQVAIIRGFERTMDMEAELSGYRQPDYGAAPGEGTLIAPLDPAIVDAYMTDVAMLEATPENYTPVAIAQLPPTPTPTYTPTPTSPIPPPPFPTSPPLPPTSAPPGVSTSAPPSPAPPSPAPPPSPPASPVATPVPTPPVPTNTPIPPPPTNTPASPPTSTPTPLPVADRFVFAPIGNQIAYYDFGVIIRVYDQYGNFFPGYNGMATLFDLTGSATPINALFVNGIWTGNVTITQLSSPDRLTANDGTLTGTSNNFNVIYPPPNIISITPNTATIKSDVTVTISGGNFWERPSDPLASLDGFPLNSLTFIDNNTLTGVISSTVMPPGYYTLTITNTGPLSPAGILTNAFTVYCLTPTITSVTPNLINNDGDVAITISGLDFYDTPTGYVDGTALLSITFVDTTTLTAVAPANSAPLAPGVYTLTISNPGPGTPTGYMTSAITITSYPQGGVTCSGGATNCPDAEVVDGAYAEVPCGGGASAAIDMGAGNGIQNGTGYDFVYYERYNPACSGGICMDRVRLELSPDNINWTAVFTWGDVTANITDTYSSLYANYPPPEADEQQIPPADLWVSSSGIPAGVAIDLGPLTDTYRYIRATCPFPAGGPVEIDGIERIH